MSNLSHTPALADRVRIRVVFMGMRCAFSIPPLQALLRSDMEVAAILAPGERGSPLTKLSREINRKVVHLPLHGAPPSIESVSAGAGLPLYAVGSMREHQVEKLIRDIAPDVIAVACFPWLVPDVIRAIPKFGCLNLHPSLLPRWRGPEPLLWTLLSGDPLTGVTVHLMDGGFDTGPILRQHEILVPQGISGTALERELAQLGGKLLVETIKAHVTGETKLINQDESCATFAPYPGVNDLLLSTHSNALELFNVIRGVTLIVGEIRLRIISSGEEVTVKQAIEFNLNESLGSPVVRSGSVVKIQCSPGVLSVTPG